MLATMLLCYLYGNTTFACDFFLTDKHCHIFYISIWSVHSLMMCQLKSIQFEQVWIEYLLMFILKNSEKIQKYGIPRPLCSCTHVWNFFLLKKYLYEYMKWKTHATIEKTITTYSHCFIASYRSVACRQHSVQKKSLR